MNNPELVIKKINVLIKDVILENNLTCYYGEKTDDLFRFYSADFCNILLHFYPEATVMINKNYLECALLIEGNVYNASGKVDSKNYIVANLESLDLIGKGFKHISYFVLEKLLDKLEFNLENNEHSYCLRKADNTI